jgi:hypothetical protein
MATVNKDFRIKNGLIVEGTTATVNGSTVLTEASTEFLQDTLAASVTGGTQTNIAVTYNDETGFISFAAENGVADSTTTDLTEGTNLYFTDERAQDAAAAMLTNATHSGISVSYDDSANTLAITNSGVTSISGTTAEVEVSASTGSVTVGLPNDVTIGQDLTVTRDANITRDLTVTGNLTVNGSTTTINSTTLSVDDKNIELASIASPTDTTADGAGITVKGTTDKTFNWVDATDSWTSSEHIDLASGKVLKVNGTQVLSATEYTGNAATVTNGAYTTNNLGVFAATTSEQLATVISDETGTGALVFATSPALTTPNIGAATATSLTLTDSLIGTATQALTTTSATVVDSWSATTYSSAKYLVQMKKGTEVQTLEVLVNVDGNNNVAITEYADVINAAASLGTTDADFSGGNVRLLVTASDETTVKVHKTLIEA